MEVDDGGGGLDEAMSDTGNSDGRKSPPRAKNKKLGDDENLADKPDEDSELLLNLLKDNTDKRESEDEGRRDKETESHEEQEKPGKLQSFFMNLRGKGTTKNKESENLISFQGEDPKKGDLKFIHHRPKEK